MITRLEVRCCCQPRRLLGWLEIDGAAWDGRVVRLVVAVAAPWTVRRPPETPTLQLQHRVVSLPVAWFSEPGQPRRLALKSEETPIETLRRIPGFTEAPQ